MGLLPCYCPPDLFVSDRTERELGARYSSLRTACSRAGVGENVPMNALVFSSLVDASSAEPSSLRLHTSVGTLPLPPSVWSPEAYRCAIQTDLPSTVCKKLSQC